MEWNELFDSGHQLGFTDMENYIGGEGKKLWGELFEYMQKSYNAKPKMTYSGCSGKPGWNVKFQKSGVSFGTLYPEENGFSVFIVIGYKLDPIMEMIKSKLSPDMLERYNKAQDYMKMGKWMMFKIEKKNDLDDYMLLMSAKMQPAK
jgi:hypothetical protein